MKLPEVTIGKVQSQGRADLGAVSGVARAKVGLAKAEASVLNTLSDLSGKYIQRKESMEHDAQVSRFMDGARAWEEQWGVKEFASADEIESMLPKGAVQLTESISDGKGGTTTMRRKNIPQYEWYGQAQSRYLEGAMKAGVDNISNNDLKTSFAQNMTEYKGKKSLTAAVSASQAQYKHVRTVVKARADKYAKQGKLEEALLDIENNYEGTNSEKAALVADARKEDELFVYREQIRIEDVDMMKRSLTILQSKDYSKNGVLNTQDNLTAQSWLRSKINAMNARNGAINALQKDQGRQAIDDAIVVLNDGTIKSEQAIEALSLAGTELKLGGKVIDLQRAHKKSPFINEMYKRPWQDHQRMIDEWIGKVASGDEAYALRLELLKKSDEIRAKVKDDPTGMWQQRDIGSVPDPQSKTFIAESIAQGLQAGHGYRVNVRGDCPRIVTQELAQKFAQELSGATVTQKATFVEQVVSQVPDKASRDAFFRQLDAKGAGHMNVVADMVDRRVHKVVLPMMEEGSKLRKEASLKLIPPQLGAEIDVQLKSLFAIPAETADMSEAVKDVYAFMARDAGNYNKAFTDSTTLDNAIAAVVGNVGEYADRPLILPNKTLTTSTFGKWVRRTHSKYIAELGGVLNMDDSDVIAAIRDEDFELRPTGVRGEYFVTDATGMYLRKKPVAGQPDENFRFIYNETRPEIKIVSPLSLSRGGGS